ncbi:MAG TPA: histidine kinase [Myxococcaceae bacterium]|nr:histidine kinase [Myxococcaceae bacterium]
MLIDIVRAHPVHIIGGVLQENPFFLAPDELLSEVQRHRARTERYPPGAPPRQSPGREAEPNAESALRWRLRDLLGVLALPAIWRGIDSDQMIQALLDVLTAMLPLDFALASLAGTFAGGKRHFVKTGVADRPLAPDELAPLLEEQLSPDRRSTAIPNPFGERNVRLASAPLGLDSRWGTVIAGSQHQDFPQQCELLLLTVACNQAALALADEHRHLLEAEKSRLEAEQLRTAADLAELRAHLEPHFLLNTLNTIAGLVTADPREARRLLVYLGDLLRDSLRDEKEMQPLQEQIEWLRRYAEIFETRYAGRLSFRWEISDQSRALLLPRLLLQPLVENAVNHGALMRPDGVVVVRSELADDDGLPASKLICTVEDNGPGLPEGGARQGFGLMAVRRRLVLKYGDRASLKLESSSSGTRSIVELPPQWTDEVRRAS